MEREVLAVDSEFNGVMQSDRCRLQQLQCHTSVPGHPFNKFFWGNKKSLIDAMDKGINLRDEILQMYNENYNGGIMKLVVIGGVSLDTLEDWVVELFNNVRAGPPLENNIQYDLPIWKASKIYRLEAVKDIHTLDLTWTLPCLHKEYLKKPEDYVSHLLGHGTEGMPLLSGSRTVSSIPFEKPRPIGGKTSGSTKIPHAYFFRDNNTKIDLGHSLIGMESTTSAYMTSWKTPNPSYGSRSSFLAQPISHLFEGNKVKSNGVHHENDLFSSSLFEIFNKKLSLTSNDIPSGQSMDTSTSNLNHKISQRKSTLVDALSRWQ